MSLSIEKNLLSKINCPICSSGSRTIDTVTTINPNSDTTVSLKECSSCAHWWHDPLPTQELLNEFYSEGNAYVVPKNYESDITIKPTSEVLPVWNKIFATVLLYSKTVSAKEKNFNYLELGVGSGDFFNFIKKKAHISYGIEPGSWAPEEESNIVPSLEIIPGGLKFDVIIAHDVLEHLSDPIDMLTQLAQYANPGCIIHCTFPNKDSLKAKLQKGRWHMVRPFGHLHYFSKKSIQMMLKKTEWKPLLIDARRISENSTLDLIRQFDRSSPRKLFRLIKSLCIGQILLGKDQWTVVAVIDKKA